MQAGLAAFRHGGTWAGAAGARACLGFRRCGARHVSARLQAYCSPTPGPIQSPSSFSLAPVPELQPPCTPVPRPFWPAPHTAEGGRGTARAVPDDGGRSTAREDVGCRKWQSPTGQEGPCHHNSIRKCSLARSKCARALAHAHTHAWWNDKVTSQGGGGSTPQGGMSSSETWEKPAFRLHVARLTDRPLQLLVTTHASHAGCAPHRKCYQKSRRGEPLQSRRDGEAPTKHAHLNQAPTHKNP